MSAIPPRTPPNAPNHTGEKTQKPAVLADLNHALAAKDEGTLNVLLHKASAQQHSQPETFRQVFNHLHNVLNASARGGTPMQHKEEVSAFLSKHGQSRLEALSHEIMHPKDPGNFQQNIAEAKSLLAAGYGGKKTAKFTNLINMRSFGSSEAPGQVDASKSTHKGEKESRSSLKNAFTSLRKGVSLLNRSAAKTVANVAKKGRREPTGGGET